MGHLTIAEQESLLEFLKKGVLSKKTQRTFKSRRFYNFVNLLKKNNLIFQVCPFCKKIIKDSVCENYGCKKFKDGQKYFHLNFDGEIVAEIFRKVER